MRTLLMVVVALILAACGGDEATPEPTRAIVPTFTPTTIAPTPDLPTATPISTVEPVQLVPTDTPFVVATVAVPAAVCDCGGDIYNCGDFDSRDAAHACFDYCIATTGQDVHGLDGDNDGQFCESR